MAERVELLPVSTTPASAYLVTTALAATTAITRAPPVRTCVSTRAPVTTRRPEVGLSARARRDITATGAPASTRARDGRASTEPDAET